MTLYDSYTETDYFDAVSFIAGTKYTITYPTLDNNGNPVNLSTGRLIFLLSPYGQPETTVLQKEAATSGSYAFVVTLEPEDTINLGGIYLQQPLLIDVDLNEFRAGQGIVNIRKAIQRT